MAISDARTERIKSQISRIEAQLDDISDALTNRLSEGRGFVSGYEFDSGQGRQKMTFTRASDLISLQEKLEAQLSRLYRILEGNGINTIVMRRKGR